MGIETGTYISDLDPQNPASTDLLKQADDHLRLIKSVLKNTFPNITGAVTLTQDELNAPVSDVPVGSILLWYGAVAAIPSGYALCDGSTVNRTDGSGQITTPNLQDRIPMGVGTTLAALGDTGGALTSTATVPGQTAPVTGSTDSQGDHSHGAGTLSAPGSAITFASRTGDYSIVGENTGPYVTDITSPTSAEAITGTTATAGAHTHAVAGDATVAQVDVTSDILPPVLGVYFIMKV